MSCQPDDDLVRLEAFRYLEACAMRSAEGVLTWQQLSRGFRFRRQRVPLIGASGIWKPALLDLPISLTTAAPRPGRPPPYDDGEGPDGTILYRYRGLDPDHRDNAGVRRVMQQRKPLIYLYGIDRGIYCPSWPVFVVDDDPARLTFVLQVDDASHALRIPGIVAEGGDARRAYITVAARRRQHQVAFRQRILRAYRSHCAVCRLKHEDLLDAAHIIPDREEGGEPRTSNGLALCKIHHAAFDRYILGIDPDCRIHIRDDVLDEIDGPMLQHGLKEMHGRSLLILPRRCDDRPDRASLEQRFERFRGYRKAE